MENILFTPTILQAIGNLSFVPNQGIPKVYAELFSKSVLSGGKRLRPKLLCLTAEHLSLSLDTVLPYAQVVEWIHAASLCHDDVVDQATLRRGLPSINCLAGNKLAVLAGDFLLAHAIRELTSMGNSAVLDLASKTIQDLAYGETLQLDLAQGADAQLEKLVEVARCKTGSLMGLAVAIPYLVSNHASWQIAYQFGCRLGVAFQQIDDCLDFSMTSLKDHFQDLQNGQINFVLYALMQNETSDLEKLVADQRKLQKAVEQTRALAWDSVAHALSLLEKLPGARSAQLEQVANFIIKREI